MAAGSDAKCLSFFRLHRPALQTELTGRFRRADFFWKDLLCEFRRLKNSDVWNEIGIAFSIKTALPFSVVLARELLVESHVRCYEAWHDVTNSDQAGKRSDTHLAHPFEEIAEAVYTPDEEAKRNACQEVSQCSS